MILDILNQEGISYDIAFERLYIIIPEYFYYAIFFWNSTVGTSGFSGR